ncbi:hypothetical protein AgCh_021271 [Apium graveolens]
MGLENVQEEEARFKAEKKNLKPKASVAKKAPRTKEKGIMIKEKSISGASKAKTRSQFEIDPKDKGKGKFDKPIKPLEMKIPQIQIKPVCKIVQVTDDNLAEGKDVQTLKRKKIFEESKTTSDKAQVVQSEELQVTIETTRGPDRSRPGVVKSYYWKDFTKSNEWTGVAADLRVGINYVSKEFLLDPRSEIKDLSKAIVLCRVPHHQNYSLIVELIFVGTTMMMFTVFDELDPFLLTDQTLEDVAQKHLDKVISVQVVLEANDKHNVKENLILFLEDGRTYQMSESDVLNKSLKELQFFHYLLEVKSNITRRWSNFILKTIRDKARIYGSRVTKFIHNIVEDDGSEIPMKKNSAKLEVILKGKYLC